MNYQRLLSGLEVAAKKSSDALISFISSHPLPAFSYPRNISNRSYDCDILSTAMLPSDVDSHIAVAYTRGDGNCLYNAVSMHLCGDCRYATELRCRAIYEMVANNSCYVSEAAACSYYDEPSFQYVANMTKNFNYSGVLEIMALANILGTCITTHYPDVNKPIRQYYNGKFSPEFRTTRTRQIHIMFTRSGSMRDARVNFWNPNHFALLVPKSALKGSTSWPGQSEKWEEMKASFTSAEDIMRPPQVIDLTESMDTGDECEHNVEFRVANCDTDVSEDHEKDRIDETKDIDAETTPTTSVPTRNMMHSFGIQQKSKNKLAGELLKYARDVLSVTHKPTDPFHIESAREVQFKQQIYFTNINTVQPITRTGWSKYHAVRKNKSFRVIKRTCKGESSAATPCTAQVIYISMENNNGTLIVPKGTHGKSCKYQRDCLKLENHTEDNIEQLMLDGETDVCHFRDIHALGEADGNMRLTIPTSLFPDNKAPENRSWGHLGKYKTKHFPTVISQERKCMGVGCQARLRYFRSKLSALVIIQHVGTHECEKRTKFSVPEQTQHRKRKRTIEPELAVVEPVHKKKCFTLRGTAGKSCSDITDGSSYIYNEALKSVKIVLPETVQRDRTKFSGPEQAKHKKRKRTTEPEPDLLEPVYKKKCFPRCETTGNSYSDITDGSSDVHNKALKRVKIVLPETVQGDLPISETENGCSDTAVVSDLNAPDIENVSRLGDTSNTAAADIHETENVEDTLDSDKHDVCSSEIGLINVFKGDQEWKGTPVTETEILSIPNSNWGQKQYSSRKKKLYKRKCNGVFKCTNKHCGGVEKRKRKCRHCRSVLKKIECSAAITYQMDDHQNVSYIQHTGSHVCSLSLCPPKNDFQPSLPIASDLPYDIDGDCVHRIATESGNPWESISDGRKWGRYVSISNNDGNTIYQRNCLGRSACHNDDCPFLRKYGRYNTAQFESVSGELLCRECGSTVITTTCKATKTFTLSPVDPGHITITHTGTHICTPAKKVPICEDEITELVRLFPNIKPAVAANTLLKQAVISGSSPNEISKIAASLLDKRKIQQVKDKERKVLFPHGTNINAVYSLRYTLEENGHDEFLIYRIEKDTPMVFTTSKDKLKIACELSGLHKELWTTLSPYAHIDFQPSRVNGMTVLGLQCYHPNLKQTVPLFKLYAPNELATVVEYGLNTFNAAVRDYSLGACERFNPLGWMCDEAGAIIKSLENVYGSEIHTKLVTCQAHYKQSIDRRKNRYAVRLIAQNMLKLPMIWKELLPPRLIIMLSRKCWRLPLV